MQSAKQLNELLKSVQDSSEVILINDYTAVFGTPFLSDFAESKIKVIKINSIANYSFFENNKNIISRINFNRLNDTLVVKIDIPGYTDFWFEGVKTELFNHEAKKQFKRNDFISILFPDEEYSGVSRLTGFNKYNFGKKMTLYVKRKLISVIWFNPAEGKYEMFRNL